ncbi:MAG: hypothetical protein ACK4VI_04400 [Alphaproteobacteria bacterium]
MVVTNPYINFWGGIALIVFISLTIMAWATGGLKAALFGVCIIFGVAIFSLIVALSITSSGIGFSSKNIILRAAGGLFSYHSYRFLLLLALSLVFLLVGVWKYLDKRFPVMLDQNIPVSEIPNSREKW